MGEAVEITTNQSTLTVYDGEQSVFTWIIEPDKNPDRYYLQRTSREKTVTFKTDAKDVSVRVLPNNAYPITFHYANNTAHAEIISRDDHSTFMQPPVALSALAVCIIFSLIAKKVLHKVHTKHLLSLGLIIPALFWLTSVVGGFMHGNYSHVSNVVSELGALDTKSELFMSVTELILAVLTVLFYLGLRRTLRTANRSLIPTIPILLFSVALVGVAFFPLNNEFHPLVGNISLPLMIAPILSLIIWRGSGLSKAYKALTIASIFCTLCFAFRFVPGINQEFEGLVQRTFYLGWSIWFVALWVLFGKTSNRKLQ